ncbi:hypothetical protein [Winogradskyella sp. 3972H.M.0a.05]|uniref:hypothetical protein n=1 Tax=Winogradskyella sp. 3972H.M.0a.05 TaxID=2950277 RepID=UPI003399F8D3
MKNLFILLSLSVLFISCDSDDDATTVTPLKLQNKQVRYHNGVFYEIDAIYNTDFKLDSLIINKFQAGPFYNLTTAQYTDGIITSIREQWDYESTSVTDVDITYDVTFDDGLVILTSDTNIIEISHTNGFIDSIVQQNVDFPEFGEITTLTRDSENNLLTYEFSNGNVINYFSDFDSGKQVSPGGTIIDVTQNHLITFLDLKVTANNPRTKAQSILGAEPILRTFSYEYDSDGYVTKTIDPGGVFYLDIFYIEP